LRLAPIYEHPLPEQTMLTWKKSMKETVWLAGLAAALATCLHVTGQNPPARPGVEPAKAELIERFLKVTSAFRFYDEIVDSVTGQYRKRFPQIQNDFWVEFRRNHTHPDDLFNQVVPIYAKYLSEEDLRNILVFFESPAGKKYTAVLPDLGREAGMAAVEFERDLNSRILKRLKESGY